MRKFWATIGLLIFWAPAVFAGGGWDDTPQQVAPPPKVVVVNPSPAQDENGWVVPVCVAALGTIGALGAAVITTRRRGRND